jgi:hypothetical protein
MEKDSKKPVKKVAEHGKKVAEHGKKVAEHVHKHLMMKISIPVIILLGLLLLGLIRVPYTAKEIMDVEEKFMTEVNRIVPDYDNPVQVRVCEEEIPRYTISDERVYGRPFGLYDYRCYADFKIRNHDNAEGHWSFKYVFNISGKIIETEPVRHFIPKYSQMTYDFMIEDCIAEDTKKGYYVLLSTPMNSICEYVTEYPEKTVTEQVEETKWVKKEARVPKKEPLWQYLIGYNRFEKV